MENVSRSTWVVIALIVVVTLIVVLFSSQSANVITPKQILDVGKEVTITLENIDTMQILSPGVYVIHDDSLSLDFEGEMPPSELESLAEYGSNDAFADHVHFMEGAVRVIRVSSPILPGDSASFDVDLAGLSGPLYLSGIQMAVGSNDGYAFLNKAEILDGSERILEFSFLANNFDAGTEENLPLLSGFHGGQPDPAFGELNIENGAPTLDVVMVHDQLTSPILRVATKGK